jgi:hypothetical protein
MGAYMNTLNLSLSSIIQSFFKSVSHIFCIKIGEKFVTKSMTTTRTLHKHTTDTIHHHNMPWPSRLAGTPLGETLTELRDELLTVHHGGHLRAQHRAPLVEACIIGLHQVTRLPSLPLPPHGGRRQRCPRWPHRSVEEVTNVVHNATWRPSAKSI